MWFILGFCLFRELMVVGNGYIRYKKFINNMLIYGINFSWIVLFNCSYK